MDPCSHKPVSGIPVSVILFNDCHRCLQTYKVCLDDYLVKYNSCFLTFILQSKEDLAETFTRKLTKSGNELGPLNKRKLLYHSATVGILYSENIC